MQFATSRGVPGRFSMVPAPNCSRYCSIVLLWLAAAALVKPGEDRPGTDGVDADPLGRVLHRQRARQPGDGRLGGVVLERVRPDAVIARIEATLTIAPPPARRISGIAAFAQNA